MAASALPVEGCASDHDLDKMASDAAKVTAYCDANPSKTVMEAADAIYGARL
jgi:outer membrane murein-binding lipoprotein Lpp